MCDFLVCKKDVKVTKIVSNVFLSSSWFHEIFFLFFSKATDQFLRVAGFRQIMQVPRWGQTFSAESLKNPALLGHPWGTDTANAADRKGQEAVRENLGVWDAAGLAVGKHFSLTNRGQSATMRRTKDSRRCHFPVSRHNVCSRCRAVCDKRLRDIFVWLINRRHWEMLAFCATCSLLNLKWQNLC